MSLKRSSSELTHNPFKRSCSSLHILIVDDNPINIELLKRSLDKLFDSKQKRKPYIREASNGMEALELINQYPFFDIILLDIDMPLLNGIDTTKRIRNQGQMIPIIAVTTNDSIESRDNYIKIGIVSYNYNYYTLFFIYTLFYHFFKKE